MSRPPPRPPSLRFALACFGSALVFLLLGSAGLVWIARDVVAGWYPLPRVLAVVHLFTLGWITLSMIASLHHFVPVALHVGLMPVRVAWAQLAAFTAGLAAFTAGELLGTRELAVAGAGLLALSLLWFALALAAAMLAVRPRSRTAHALLAAAAFLVLTVVLGAGLAVARAYGWAAGDRLALLSLHIRVALVGWVLLVVVAVGQRLLPMFLLTRAPGARLAATSLLLVAAGPLAAFAAFLLGSPASGLLLLPTAAGAGIFLAQAAATFRRRAPQQVDPGLLLAGAGLGFLTLALLAFPATIRPGALAPQQLVLLVGGVVIGALSLFVAGHYYRLVPFLVWSARWATLRDTASGPRSPAALYGRRTAAVTLFLLPLGAATLGVSVAGGLSVMARLGGALFACGAATLAWQMARVMASRPR